MRAAARFRESKLDVLLVNPPAPDGGIWIRSQHRVGRRSRENMIWPQVSLAQLGGTIISRLFDRDRGRHCPTHELGKIHGSPP